MMKFDMPFIVRSGGVEILWAATREQAVNFIADKKKQNPNQEFTIVPSGETKSSEIEQTAPNMNGYGSHPVGPPELPRPARPSRPRPVARGSRHLKPGGSKGGISAGGGGKGKKSPWIKMPRRKQGRKKYGSKK
jgi:hypothetical protein